MSLNRFSHTIRATVAVHLLKLASSVNL